MMTRISITVTTVRVVDLLAEGERMPVYVHVIDHPDARYWSSEKRPPE
jgi:N-acyl homoserine lactone hydrolase